MTWGRGGSAAATVIIPTHDHSSTLDLAIASVLNQSSVSLELVVIGDGVGDDTRDVIAAIGDSRLHFIDAPKSRSRGELIRHRVLTDASGDFVCYLGDDDIMLPDHIQKMSEALQFVDFVHPLPIYILPDEIFATHPTDLSQVECRNWHLDPGRNAVSLTGAAHRLDAYRRLPVGWREPPAGRWSDHYMWEQWFRTPGFLYATNPQLTVLKFDSSVRAGWSSADRRSEVLEWIERAKEKSFPDWLQCQATAALLKTASSSRVHADHVADARASESAHRLAIERELADVRAQLRLLEAELCEEKDGRIEVQGALEEVQKRYRDQANSLLTVSTAAAENLQRAVESESECTAVKATRTWKIHDRLTGSVVMRRLVAWVGG